MFCFHFFPGKFLLTLFSLDLYQFSIVFLYLFSSLSTYRFISECQGWGFLCELPLLMLTEGGEAYTRGGGFEALTCLYIPVSIRLGPSH